jgi:hypothetical protein
MNAPALPAYLQNRQSQGVAARATAGMGGVLPPHISIAGNGYTLIDAAGNKMPLGPTMSACVVDISDHMNKRYYENDWTPGSDEPPTCFSRNGVAPSRDSQTPQSPTCATCQWNVRGSDTSKLSGKPIKACRDEKDLAVLLPQFPNMLFQLTVPPGSFKNWSAFTTAFKSGGPDVSDVLISFGFQPQANGVMTFQATSYIDEATFAVREQALTAKATDVLVGRNDVPIALPASAQPSQTVATTAQPQLGAPAQPAQFGGQPAAQVPFGTQNVQTAMNPGTSSTTHQPAPSAAGTAAPTEKLPRTRRTREQIAADNAAKATAQAGGSPPGQAPVQSQAPFPVNQSGGFGAPQNPLPASGAAAPTGNPSFGLQGQPSGAPIQQGTPTAFGQGSANTASPSNTGTFGIQNGADPNVDPALAEMLRTLGQ